MSPAENRRTDDDAVSPDRVRLVQKEAPGVQGPKESL